MTQRVVIKKPPIYDEAREIFGPIVERAIFSWGDVIYNPSDAKISPALYAHEAVHGTRQLKIGVKEWWNQYLESPQFRLDEEIPAHKAEYLRAIKHANRNHKRFMLKQISARLSGPLYGRLIPSHEARKILTA